MKRTLLYSVTQFFEIPLNCMPKYKDRKIATLYLGFVVHWLNEASDTSVSQIVKLVGTQAIYHSENLCLSPVN
jgi:hypothetical protein